MPILSLLVLFILLFVFLALVRHWNIHGTDYERKAKIRKALYSAPIINRLVVRKNYGVGVQHIGYNAALRLPRFGTLGYVTRKSDGADGDIQFLW